MEPMGLDFLVSIPQVPFYISRLVAFIIIYIFLNLWPFFISIKFSPQDIIQTDGLTIIPNIFSLRNVCYEIWIV
ncbi:MAG: hypothetical protein K0S01_1555 [Herbinix sp.]|jgi:hypothetical protein|nr:hypothetical protein [Herbinix sp.]